MIDEAEFFGIYFPLRLHFSEAVYDIFKSKRRTINNDLFKRRDMKIMVAWANKMASKTYAGNFCLAQFAVNPNRNWLYASFEEAKEWFDAFKSMKQAQSYFLQEDCEKISDMLDYVNGDMDVLLNKTPSGKKAPLVQLFMQKIRPDSVAILDKFGIINLDTLSGEYCDDPLVDDMFFRLKKYRGFVAINDIAKCEDVITSLKSHMRMKENEQICK